MTRLTAVIVAGAVGLAILMGCGVKKVKPISQPAPSDKSEQVEAVGYQYKGLPPDEPKLPRDLQRVYEYQLKMPARRSGEATGKESWQK